MMIWLVVAKHPLLWTLFGVMIPTDERMFLRGVGTTNPNQSRNSRTEWCFSDILRDALIYQGWSIMYSRGEVTGNHEIS